MSELRSKTIHELRGMAAAFGVPDVFQKDQAQLVQDIEMRQEKLVAPKRVLPPRPEYDPRLMTKAPSRKTDWAEIKAMLPPFEAMGLVATFDDERWYFRCGKKTDEGSLRMPLRHVIICAEKLVK